MRVMCPEIAGNGHNRNRASSNDTQPQPPLNMHAAGTRHFFRGTHNVRDNFRSIKYLF